MITWGYWCPQEEPELREPLAERPRVCTLPRPPVRLLCVIFCANSLSG